MNNGNRELKFGFSLRLLKIFRPIVQPGASAFIAEKWLSIANPTKHRAHIHQPPNAKGLAFSDLSMRSKEVL